MEQRVYSVIYSFNGLLYNVLETSEKHRLLRDDDGYAEKYFAMNKHSLDVVGVDSEDQKYVQGAQSSHTVEVADEFEWNMATTKLLLAEYDNRKDQFRHPKVKKRNLWMEIEKAFKDKGYTTSYDQLDSKFRNLKKTFKAILDNNNKKTTTGKGRISWIYYDLMAKIFENDKTINPPYIISSITTSSASAITVSSSTASSSIESSGVASANTSKKCTVQINAPSVSKSAIRDNFNTSPVNLMDDSNKENKLSDDSDNAGEPEDINKKRKRKGSRESYYLKKQQLQIERKKLEKLKELKETVENSNKIQEKRNELLEKLLKK